MSATPKEMVAGGKAGVGISVGLVIVNDDAIAEIAAGAAVNLSAAGATSIVSSGGHVSQNTVEAGASSNGVSFVPAIAVTISNVSRQARIRTDGDDPTVDVGGAVTLAARANTAETAAHTSAKGAAKSAGSAAIGVAFALTIANHDVLAQSDRSIDADGAVTLEAIGQSSSSATAIASAQGESASNNDPDSDGVETSGSGGINELADGETAQADNQATASGAEGSGGATAPTADSSSGPINVAAAVAINLATTNASAIIPLGVTIESGGVVTVRAMSNTDATASADGSSSDGGSASVGVGVGINLANVTTLALVRGTVISNGLVVEAGVTSYFGDVTQTFGATAISGASGNGVSVALSLALAISNVTHTAELVDGSSVTINGGGDIGITASSLGETTVVAKPSEPVAGKSVGIGASVAIGLVDDFVTATIGGAAVLVLNSANNLSVLAVGGHSLSSTAEAGASGGVAVVPAIAISLSNVKRIAIIANTSSAGAITLTGSLTVAGRAPPSDNLVTSTAKGSAESSGDAAIGVALALSIGDHVVSARLERSVISSGLSGNVLVEAIGRSRVLSDATASAEGAPGEGDADESSANEQIGDQRDHADSTSTDNGGSGTAPAEASSGSNGEQANDSSGPVGVAAAIAVNIAGSSSTASIADGLTITTGGSVTVRSSANADGRADANGKAMVTGGSAGIGAAVAVNVLTVTNTATLGDTTVTGNGVSVEALMTASSLDPIRRWDLASGEWQVVEQGEKLPEIVLYQYEAASGGDDAKWIVVPSGTELPASAAETDDKFRLTAEDDGKAPGIYKWDGANWVSFNDTIDQGSDFPDKSFGAQIGLTTPADKSLFKLDPEDNAYFNLIKQDGLKAPGVYTWDEVNNKWDLVPGAVPSGAFLPGSAGSSQPAPAANALFRLSTHEGQATTQAGGGADDVGVGGAVSINIVTVTTTATVPTGAIVSAGNGDSNIEAQSNNLDKSVAAATAKGGDAGVGIGVSVQVLTVTTTADIADLVPFTGSDDLTIKATTRQDVENSANAGSASSSGAAVSPAVSLTISNVTTRAYVGSPVLDIFGNRSRSFLRRVPSPSRAISPGSRP